MAKQHRKQQVVQSKDQKGQMIEEILDDSLLPDANEIAQLYTIDPTIMDWLKERAEKEQDFRHAAYDKRIKLVSKTERGTRWVNYWGLFLSFFLLAGGMYLSYYLIQQSHEVIGTMFSGAVLLGIASIFMSKVKSNNREKTNR